MPNHIFNRIIINSKQENVDKVLDEVQNDLFGKGSIDFEKLIPMPEDVFRGALGQEERKMYGENNWYDWSVKNWGTKWNAYGYTDLVNEAEQGNIVFNTAWDSVPRILLTLSERYPEIEFKYQWADEEYGYNVGEAEFLNGEAISFNIPRNLSNQAFELAGEITGVSPEDAGFRYDEKESRFIWDETAPDPSEEISQ